MANRWKVLSVFVFVMAFAVQAQSDLSDRISEFLARIAPENSPAIVVSIAYDDGQSVVSVAHGRVDITQETLALPTDRFRIASISKTFLATALLLLEEDGVLSLEDGLGDWLDESVYGRLPNADEVTLYDLVTMRSGIPDYLDDVFFGAILASPSRVWTAEEVLAYAYDTAPEFAPDEDFEYSNTNYILLQLVVESATGKTLAEVFRERIFTPLNMNETYTQISETLPNGFVHGYEDLMGLGVEEDVTDVNDGAGLGDGALVSTTEDLVRFFKALLIDKTVLSSESLEAMLTPTDDENQYGIGIEIREGENTGTVYGHTGSVVGFSSAVFYAPQLETIVVILYGYQGLEEEHIEELFSLAAE